MNPTVSGGTLLPELTTPATEEQILTGRQAIDQNGEILTGSMPEITVPNPTISVSNSGVVTASSAYSAGHTSGGTASNTYQLTTQAAKTITPSSSSQTAVASGRYTTGAITVAGDSDLVAGNIRSGINIFGVTGNYSGEDVQFANIPLNNISLGSNRMTINWPYPIKQLCGLQLYGHRTARSSNSYPGDIFLIYPCLEHMKNDDGVYSYYPNAFSSIDFEREESGWMYQGTLSRGIVTINSITSTQLITASSPYSVLPYIDEWYGACYSYIPA